jgi:hypothetical protein
VEATALLTKPFCFSIQVHLHDKRPVISVTTAVQLLGPQLSWVVRKAYSFDKNVRVVT